MEILWKNFPQILRGKRKKKKEKGMGPQALWGWSFPLKGPTTQVNKRPSS